MQRFPVGVPAAGTGRLSGHGRGRAPGAAVAAAFHTEMSGPPAGLNFTHVSGASEQKSRPRSWAPAACSSTSTTTAGSTSFSSTVARLPIRSAPARTHRLFRNRGNGTFEDVTHAGTSATAITAWALRGRLRQRRPIDLYVTNVGPNVLYRNAGARPVHEVPNAGGADAATWSTSCAFLDFDRDGDLDLFVTNYVDIRLKPDLDIERVLRECRPAANPRLLSSAGLSRR